MEIKEKQAETKKKCQPYYIYICRLMQSIYPTMERRKKGKEKELKEEEDDDDDDDNDE